MAASIQPSDGHVCTSPGLGGRSWETNIATLSTYIWRCGGCWETWQTTHSPPNLTSFFCYTAQESSNQRLPCEHTSLYCCKALCRKVTITVIVSLQSFLFFTYNYSTSVSDAACFEWTRIERWCDVSSLIDFGA